LQARRQLSRQVRPDDEYCALRLNPLMPGTCTVKPKAGEKCAAGLGDAKYCAPYTRCDADVCREIAHAGEECNADDTCYSSHCVGNACVTGNSCEDVIEGRSTGKHALGD
jgi:hypothetical protein